jgi:hypothetical protein
MAETNKVEVEKCIKQSNTIIFHLHGLVKGHMVTPPIDECVMDEGGEFL